MHPKQFALVAGIVMLLFGLVAFVPALSISPEDAGLPGLNLDTSYGLLFGFFPMNIINKLVFVVFGLAGIYCATRPTTNLPASIHFSRWVFVTMGIAAVLGLFPATATLFGYWPLFDGVIVAHAAFAALGAYFGFVLSSRADEVNRERFASDDRRAS
jgi:uncharacterized membrane protein HdeD (DUF308 family)